MHMCIPCCSKIAEAEAVVSVNEKKLLEMHMYMQVQLMQYELRGPPNPWLLFDGVHAAALLSRWVCGYPTPSG
jgi:hypothetical protein